MVWISNLLGSIKHKEKVQDHKIPNDVCDLKNPQQAITRLQTEYWIERSEGKVELKLATHIGYVGTPSKNIVLLV